MGLPKPRCTVGNLNGIKAFNVLQTKRLCLEKFGSLSYFARIRNRLSNVLKTDIKKERNPAKFDTLTQNKINQFLQGNDDGRCFGYRHVIEKSVAQRVDDEYRCFTLNKDTIKAAYTKRVKQNASGATTKTLEDLKKAKINQGCTIAQVEGWFDTIKAELNVDCEADGKKINLITDLEAKYQEDLTKGTTNFATEANTLFDANKECLHLKVEIIEDIKKKFTCTALKVAPLKVEYKKCLKEEIKKGTKDALELCDKEEERKKVKGCTPEQLQDAIYAEQGEIASTCTTDNLKDFEKGPTGYDQLRKKFERGTIDKTKFRGDLADLRETYFQCYAKLGAIQARVNAKYRCAGFKTLNLRKAYRACLRTEIGDNRADALTYCDKVGEREKITGCKPKELDAAILGVQNTLANSCSQNDENNFKSGYEQAKRDRLLGKTTETAFNKKVKNLRKLNFQCFKDLNDLQTIIDDNYRCTNARGSDYQLAYLGCLREFVATGNQANFDTCDGSGTKKNAEGSARYNALGCTDNDFSGLVTSARTFIKKGCSDQIKQGFQKIYRRLAIRRIRKKDSQNTFDAKVTDLRRANYVCLDDLDSIQGTIDKDLECNDAKLAIY